MKIIYLNLALIITTLGCTRKYAQYDVIHKLSFIKSPETRPVTPSMKRAGTDSVKRCFDQWLFFSNAETEKDKYLPQLIQVLCPKTEWLMETQITQDWWTSIIFSQACVNVKTTCPLLKP